MITQNHIILTDLINQKQRELRAEGDAARLAKSARPERRPQIRIAGKLGGWLRHAVLRVSLPRHR